ncbi:formate dehydrogenase accessory protein FdhE [Megalodesulfovibrio gigas]|uniref:Putative formate dehydrogenase accessory protein n=1 Tax=Megalodesulfovibrio gigas (strain ATCC 19364 / DSM 1382 / NCIMB 9332 / VKM B-1759) TaxID=1121448 RepID=T2G8Q3_MEGG1|nr:formate dehydrogenase accessory protein FdhE [Megalodesulfovibrio gigas]AGW12658.1 putative formate dehydrogenase accessory protein [Megalodesulfovibrio gigas DSM 1382 = ATCC 19364]
MSQTEPQPAHNFNELRAAIRQRIQRLATVSYLPSPLVDLVGQVTLAQLDVLDPAVTAITLQIPAPDEADLASRDRLALGVPLLERSRFPWDADAAERLFFTLAGLLAAMPGQAGEAGRRILLALEEDAGADLPPLSPRKAAQAFINEDQEFFEAFATAMPQSPRAVSFLAQASITPSLIAVAEALHPQLDLTTDVRPHGNCPVCGSLPLIACLQDKEGKRRVSCSFCRTTYRVRRLGCLLCGEDRNENLGFLAGEEMPGFRIEYCNTCSGYTKAIDLRLREGNFLPVLDDLESLPLDMLAGQAGFRRPTVSGLGF